MISIIYGELNKLARLEYQSKINRRYDRNIYIYSIPVFLMFAPPRSTEGGNSRNLKLIKITKCCKPGNHRPVPADLECRIEQPRARTRHPASLSSQIPVESSLVIVPLSSAQYRTLAKTYLRRRLFGCMSLYLCLTITLYPLYKLHSIQISDRLKLASFVRNFQQLGARLKARR